MAPTKPFHFMDPNSNPKYHVPCGDGDKIFGEGHGASIYWYEVTCEKCLEHQPKPYKLAFPNFDDELPMIEGWEDSSWRADSCPSISRPVPSTHQELDLQIYVDYKDPALREHPGILRYSLLDVRGNWTDEESDSITLCDSDSWEEILEAVKAFDLKNAG